jgi:hypothetical protein
MDQTTRPKRRAQLNDWFGYSLVFIFFILPMLAAFGVLIWMIVNYSFLGRSTP